MKNNVRYLFDLIKIEIVKVYASLHAASITWEALVESCCGLQTEEKKMK